MTGVPTSPQGVGQVLDAGFKLFRASFKGTIGLALLAGLFISVPSAILAFYPGGMEAIAAGGSGAGFWIVFGIAYVLSMLLYTVFFAAIIHYCDSVARSGAPSMGASVKVGFVKLLILLAAVILYMIAVWVGMILLIIPGLILMVSLFFYINRIVLEYEGPIRALCCSHRLVWGNWWHTFLVSSVMMIFYIVIQLAVGMPIVLLDELLDQSLVHPVLGGPFTRLGQVAAFATAMPCVAAMLVSLYYDLQLRSEGGDLASRVDELAPPN